MSSSGASTSLDATTCYACPRNAKFKHRCQACPRQDGIGWQYVCRSCAASHRCQACLREAMPYEFFPDSDASTMRSTQEDTLDTLQSSSSARPSQASQVDSQGSGSLGVTGATQVSSGFKRKARDDDCSAEPLSRKLSQILVAREDSADGHNGRRSTEGVAVASSRPPRARRPQSDGSLVPRYVRLAADRDRYSSSTTDASSEVTIVAPAIAPGTSTSVTTPECQRPPCVLTPAWECLTPSSDNGCLHGGCIIRHGFMDKSPKIVSTAERKH